jgi:hypothetical protein
MTDPAAPPAPAPKDSASAAEDLIDIFIAPSKVYERRAKASPMMPFLIVWVVLSALFFTGKGVLGPVFDAEIQGQLATQMKNNPQLTPDMVEKMKPMMAISLNVAGVAGPPIVMLVVALIAWIVGRFIMGGNFSYGTALLIVAFAWFPKILEGVIDLCQGLLLDVTKMSSHFQLTLGVGRFLDPATTSQGMIALLGRIDLFTLWVTVLIVIGLIHAGKVEKGKAVGAGVIIWCIGAVPALFALLRGT